MSHYQVEGNDRCDWSDWPARGGACGDAVGAWSRYEDDAMLARKAGANAFRFSVSWSRIEPRRGEFNDAALERYTHFVEHLNTIGLEPAVTLFHYTHPLWFHEETPWTSPASVDRFAQFAGKVAQAFGNRVRLYIPINEPVVFLLAAYLDGQIPPGWRDARLLSRVFDHLLAAHAASAAAIREHVPDAAIGIAHNMMAFAPDRRWNPLDRLLRRTSDRCYNRGLIEAFATGRWKFLLPPATIIRGRREELPRSLDLFGINFYSRLHLRCPGKRLTVGDFAYRDRSGRGLTDNGWEIVPEELQSMIDAARAVGVPLVITENGLADGADRLRPDFLRDHFQVIRRNDIHGYFHWSLLDNYEWLDAFGPRFGLYEVDRSTMERRPRASVGVFRSLGEQFLTDSR